MVVKHATPPVGETCNKPDTTTMTIFDFKSIYTLELSQEDDPSIDVRDGKLVLTAKRGEERIMITAPLSSVIAPVAPIVGATQIKQPRRSYRRRNSNKGRLLDRSHPSVGENSIMAKLSEVSVKEIRELASDEKYIKSFQSRQAMLEDLAKVYKVHWTTIWSIVNRRSWKHVH